MKKWETKWAKLRETRMIIKKKVCQWKSPVIDKENTMAAMFVLQWENKSNNMYIAVPFAWSLASNEVSSETIPKIEIFPAFFNKIL